MAAWWIGKPMAEMTAREIVKRCIEFRQPPRIGMHFEVLPIDGRVWHETDFALVSYLPDPAFQPRHPGADEWGVVKISLDPSGQGVGEAKINPLAEGWHLLAAYPFPDFANPARYAGLAERVAGLHAQGKYVYGDLPSLMSLPADLRGMENWYADHLLEPENIGRLLDRILEIRLTIIEQYAQAGMDGAITWDDMGDNERVFFRPAIFRALYLPRYQATTAALHARGMHFIHHCCGQVRQYMPLFVEGGCDVLQLDQPERMGIDWLGEHFGGKICFWNSIDIQKTMPTGDLAAIAAEARRQILRFGNFDGGFMVKSYEQPLSVGITAAAFEAQREAFHRYGNYPLSGFED
jgi:uroporphyrinogen decarboxylase